MKIAVVWPWEGAKWVRPFMHDGLVAAFDLITKEHQVDWYLCGDTPEDKYDWIMPWGVSSIPFNRDIEKYKAKKALLCAGHPQDRAFLNKFDVVFVETPLMYELTKPYCKKIVLAFGTDTDYFKPRKVKKAIDAFFPATFSPWKRQDLFARAIGKRGIVCGIIQPDGLHEHDACMKSGVYTLAGLMPSYLVSHLYNMARTCVVTSWHGSERTVLEAMASNLPVVLTNDNALACSLLPKEGIKVDPSPKAIKKGFEKALTMKVNTREYILKNYSHKIYAKRILEAIT
jgi:glycosyltransferase involved in cell wall biosynthesis